MYIAKWVYFQYEQPIAIRVQENATARQNISYVRACNPDTESPIYYYLIGSICRLLFASSG